MVNLSECQRESLQLVLSEYDEQYDPDERMVRSEASKVGYHTTIDEGVVHSTRTSLAYAVALLDSGDDKNLERAAAILRRVISLQDQDPESKTYGIWSWYLEEPLEQMSPPDWNWADFCGVQLLAAYCDHHHRLSDDLNESLKQSIIHAARSIERRNMGPHYTNISIMGTYVTLVAAETFGLPDLLTYAKERARGVHEYITYHGSFNEYNSSTYTVVAVKELTRILMDAQDEETRRLIKKIHNLAWRHIARHFHPPTRQWAGPHSRCYQTDLRDRPGTLAFIQAGTHDAVRFFENQPLPLDLDACRLSLACPDEYIPLFVSLEKETTVVETFTRAEPETEGKKLPIIGTTFLGKHLTLGSVNHSMLWNQRRAILAYWGTPDRPTYLHVRFMHDGYDYCSAMVATAQQERDLLAAVTFATDRGDTHPNLDPLKDGTIEARDLRLRFDFGADISSLELPGTCSSGSPVQFTDRDVAVSVYLLAADFGKKKTRMDVHREDEHAYLDVILHEGEPEKFDFLQMNAAFIAFCLRVAERPAVESDMPWDAFARVEKDRCTCFWKRPGGTLLVSVPKKPMPYRELQDSFEMEKF
ncbi:MAG: hypothetical protein ABIH23_24100 [bacterium]